jgi:hypothetical protein
MIQRLELGLGRNRHNQPSSLKDLCRFGVDLVRLVKERQEALSVLDRRSECDCCFRHCLRRSNAALEWQAETNGWRSLNLQVACPLKGLVRRHCHCKQLAVRFF